MNTGNKFLKNIIFCQMKKHWAAFGGLQLCLILSNLITAVATAEILRQMTEAIWRANYRRLLQVLLLLGGMIGVTFLLSVFKRKSTLLFKEQLICAGEDAVYEVYSQQEYWIKEDGDKILGHIRRIIPEAVEQLMSQVILFWGIVVVIVGGSLYGSAIDPYVLTVALGVTVLLVLLSGKSKGKVAEFYQEFNENNSRMYQLLWEQVKNREIAGFLEPQKVLEEYEESSEKYLKSLLQIKKATNGPELFSQFGCVILIVLVSFLGGIFVLEGKLVFSDLLALIVLVQTLASRFFQIPVLVQGCKKLKGYLKNIDVLLQIDEREVENIKRQSLRDERVHTIDIKNLSFFYLDTEKKVLENVNLTLHSGIFYAVAGESGCGKTTLVHLLARFLSEWEGDILINGFKLERLNREDYWKHVTIVEQTPVIVPDSLLYNITLEEKNYDREKLKKAICDAALEEYVRKVSENLDIPVSETELSKGEMKKINIARAFYRESEILLLDEITEGLDPGAELHILKALKQRAEEGALVLCVSHKLETLEFADQVVFLNEGYVEGIASHKEWVEKNSEYRKMTERMQL